MLPEPTVFSSAKWKGKKSQMKWKGTEANPYLILTSPSCAVKSQCFYLAGLILLMGCWKRKKIPLLQRHFGCLAFVGIHLRSIMGADYLFWMRGNSIPWVQWEMLKCVPGAKKRPSRDLRNQSGEKSNQSAELNNNKKRQSQQTLKPQRWQVHYPLKPPG